jgi:hypothetical protein
MSDQKLRFMVYSLGKSGLKVSKIILGTMGFGSKEWQDWVLDEEDSLPLIEHAYKRGINTWDTVSIRSMIQDPAFESYTNNCNRPTSTLTAAPRRL